MLNTLRRHSIEQAKGICVVSTVSVQSEDSSKTLSFSRSAFPLSCAFTMPSLPLVRPLPSTCSLSAVRIFRPPARPFSQSLACANTKASVSAISIPPPPPARWISDLKARVGKCIIFGCDNQQVSRAASVLRALSLEWRELLAGSEGFLTGGRRGLDGQKIAWGEMDSFVSGHVQSTRQT